MQKILGLDIGSYSIKAVEIINTFKNYKVVGFHEVIVPEIEGLDASDIGSTAIRQIFAQNDIEADKIYTGVMGVLASTRIFEFQSVKKRNLGSVIQSELENLAPFRTEDVVIDHQVLDVRNGVSSVLAVMARKDDVEAYLNQLRELNIDPKVIDVDYVSTMNLAPFLKSDDDEDDDAAETRKAAGLKKRRYRLLVDVGHQKTSVVLFAGSRLIAARTIRIAGRYFTEYLQKNLGVSFGEAQRIKHAVSRIETSEEARPLPGQEREFIVARLLGTAVTELVREVVRTLHSFVAHEKAAPEAVYLCGGSACISGLREFMTQALGTSVEPFSFNTEKLIIDDDIAHHMDLIVQPLALGLRGVHNKRQSQINLRRGELALVGSYDRVINQIANVSLMFGSLLVCLLASYMLRWYLYGDQIKNLKTDYRNTVKQILKTEPPELQRIAGKGDSWDFKNYSTRSLKLIENEIREAEVAVKHFSERQSVFPLRILEDVSKAIPKQTQGPGGVTQNFVVDVLEFTVQGKTVNIEGETDSRGNAESIGSLVKGVANLQNVNLTHSAKTGSDKIIKFRVQANLKEGQ